MKRRSTHFIPPIIFFVLLLAALACSLTADPPATLPPATSIGGAPPSTITPSGPIGPQATIATPIPSPQPPAVLPEGVRPSVETNVSLTADLLQVDSARQMNIIETLVGFKTRNAFSDPDPSSLTGGNAARDYLRQELLVIRDANPDRNISVEVQPFDFPYNGKTDNEAFNVVMILNGTDTTGEIIVVGAHYDTINVNGGSNSVQPGANDNGSGVAALLEMARILAQRQHRGTIVLVFFGAEEQGRFGSAAFLQDFMLARNIVPSVMLNMDIIGSASGPNGEWDDMSVRVFSDSDDESRQLARLIEFVAHLYVGPFKVELQDRLDRPGRWGDHMTFAEAGIPSVRFTESMEEPIKAHTTRDTIDDITPEYLRRNTQVVLATVLVLADGLAPPSMIRLDTNTWRLDWLRVTNASGYAIALRGAGQLNYNTVLQLADVTQLVWDQLQGYESISIAALDDQGHIGPFSEEYIIPIGSTGQ